jgi:DNA mismatch endonuclease (patch repair protein)
MKSPQVTPEDRAKRLSTMRSAIMRAVRSRNTGPELRVRALLRPIAPGYRLHRKDVPGSPDIAYVGARRAIFVHGCFWHGHTCSRGARTPKSNADYWLAKIARNRARDTRNLEALAARGWRSLVVWECELTDEAALRDRLRAFVCDEPPANRAASRTNKPPRLRT